MASCEGQSMPCKPGMAGCKLSCLHRARVQLYYESRDAQMERAIVVSRSEDPQSEEMRAFFRDPNVPATYPSEQKIVFKQHLIDTRGENMARHAPEQPKDAEDGYASCGAEAQRDSQGSWWHIGFSCDDKTCVFVTVKENDHVKSFYAELRDGLMESM